jgi:hypothetical protein
MPMQEKGQEEFQRETGIDIERDIQYVVAAVTPGTQSALLVARGNFNPTHLESLAVQHGGAVETYRETRLISKVVGDQASKSGTLAFLEPGLVAIGDTATIKRAIDAQLSSASVTSNDEIMTLVSDIEQGNNAWAVGRFDVLTSHAKLPEQIARQIPPVKWFAAAGHINGGVSGMVRVEANDDQAAELLRRQVNGALAFGEMMGRSDARVSAALKTIQASGSGKTVQLSFTVPAELLQLVMPQAPAVAIEPQWPRVTPAVLRCRRAGNAGCRPLLFPVDPAPASCRA